MIGYMGAQQKKQLEGLEELAQFTSRETELFLSNFYPYLLEQVHQNLAKAALASTWLSEDLAVIHNDQDKCRLSSLAASLESNKTQVGISTF